MTKYRLKTGKFGEAVKSTFEKVENRVVEGSKKAGDCFVGAYKKIETKFVDKYLEPIDPEQPEK